ncbi:cyclic AMP-dependent transcription factor ATF-2 isoform X2 [Neocloeon triangulifer]|uniref:cyclic AMP-dependent transcription factor ATF-2 isoform X2 n=1 Tax=Neocloeon triangulifer TaxID=2078957 RepID=UPI00286F0F67|nr:cyclic AMP-dependent transcription factor ATF-2 isoform X2 [Neocloeon triangulifer]
MCDPEKPFVCTEQGCGMSFTNEDHLTVHKKKHDMCLSIAGKNSFIADQTPTPTRFIRYGEEVGLFQDLQNVNPFEEQFKKAAEAVKMGEAPLQPEPMAGPIDDALHTPQVFPIRHIDIMSTPEKELETSHREIEMLPKSTILLESEVQKSAEPLVEPAPAHMVLEETPATVDSKKYLPIIQLPNGRFVTMNGEPVEPTTMPTVVIQCSYTTTPVDAGAMVAENLVPVSANHILAEPVAGPSNIHILPKPVAPAPPPKLSLAKEKLKEKVSRKRVAVPSIVLNDESNSQPSKPVKMNKSQISKKNVDDKASKKLERNRAAAARFRKKKKHLEGALLHRVQELEDKVKDLQNENRRITNQMMFYRAEAANAKDLLLAHRDCSVTRQLSRTEVIAVVDSSTQMQEVVTTPAQELVHVDSTAELFDVRHVENKPPETPISVRRMSSSKAPNLAPLMIIRPSSVEGNDRGVLRFTSGDSVIVENVQRAITD